MSIIASSAGLVQAASLLMHSDSTILGNTVNALNAGIVLAQDADSKLRPEFSLLSTNLEDYYTRFSKEAQVVSIGVPDVRLGFRYTTTDTGYTGFYGRHDNGSGNSTLYFVQGGYSALPGAGVVYRAGVGVWDMDTVYSRETGWSLEATQQEIVLEGTKLEKFRSATLGFTMNIAGTPHSAGLAFRYSEDRPDIALVKNDDSKYGTDMTIVQCHRKNLDLLISENTSQWWDLGDGWVTGLNLQFIAGFRAILAWEDFQKVGKRRLAGVVGGDSLLIEDGPLSFVGNASAKATVGHGWVLPNSRSLLLLSISARFYVAGAEIYGMDAQNRAANYGTAFGIGNQDSTQWYGYSLRPHTRDVGLQLSWDASMRF